MHAITSCQHARLLTKTSICCFLQTRRTEMGSPIYMQQSFPLLYQDMYVILPCHHMRLTLRCFDERIAQGNHKLGFALYTSQPFISRKYAQTLHVNTRACRYTNLPLLQGNHKWVLGLLGFTLAALAVSIARAEAAFAMLVEASHRLHDTMLGEPWSPPASAHRPSQQLVPPTTALSCARACCAPSAARGGAPAPVPATADTAAGAPARSRPCVASHPL
jgi:hypothetical protein